MSKARELVELLEKYSEAYYQGNALISDESFDALEDELRRIDPSNPYFNKNRETAKGYGTKHPHIYQFVGSIEKIHSVEESSLLSIASKALPVNLSAKLDGTSMVVYYENGKLVHALTRGDGNYGLDVTQHYEAIISKYNLAIPTNFTGAIRGEVVFSNANWLKFKEIHPEAKMARNSGTGLINQKTVQPEASLLDYVAYDVLASSIAFKDVFQFLEEMGFTVAPNVYIYHEVEERELEVLFKKWSDIYPLDGIVIRVDSLAPSEKGLYFLTKRQEAFKFQAETKACRVTGITWGLGRTGKLVPVIQIEPTELSGAVVTNVTGHNAQTIYRLSIGVGSIITVRRSGEVIPYLDEVLTPTEPQLPTTCPHCNEPLSWTSTMVDLVCNNENCSGQQYKKMENYILTMCKDIKGIGEAFIEGFITYFNATDVKGLLTSINNYAGEEITTLGAANNKIAREVISVLTNKTQNPADFLQALGIKLLGTSFAAELSASIHTKQLFEALYSKDERLAREVVLKILPNRYALADSIVSNLPLISAILEVIYSNGQSFNFNENSSPAVAYKRYYAVTGSVSKPRKEFEAELLEKGWVMTDTISKAEILINNDTTSNSSKNLKARQAGKPILSEQQFREMYL